MVHPGTTQCVNVVWPVLANVGFEELSEQGMLWEFYVFIVGHAQLAHQSQWNPEWLWLMNEPRGTKSPNLVNTAKLTKPESDPPVQQSERTEQLVAQLGLMDNRLLSNHPEVRSKMISFIDHYEAVFTDGKVAVGKTD